HAPPPFITTPSQAPTTTITKEKVDAYYAQQFNKELNNTPSLLKNLQNNIEAFKHHVINFSQQPLDYQKNYDNLEKLIIELHSIHPKKVLISINKLLQYIESAHYNDISTANKLINTFEQS